MFCCRNEKFSLHISFRHHHLTHIFISTGIEEAKEKQSQRCYGGIVIHMLTELMKGGKFNWRDFPRKKKSFSFFFLSTPSIPQIESCAMMEKNVTLMWTESRLTLLSFACYQRAALSTHPCIRAKQHRNWCRRKKMIFFYVLEENRYLVQIFENGMKKKVGFSSAVSFVHWHSRSSANCPAVAQTHSQRDSYVLPDVCCTTRLSKCNQLGRKFCSQLS